MKKRIQIDGVWFIEEAPIEQNFDITYSYEASSGIFDFTVLVLEVDDDKRFEVVKHNCWVDAHTNGRNGDCESWDNADFLRNVRDGIYEYDIEKDLTTEQLSELQNLLIAVTEKGWL